MPRTITIPRECKNIRIKVWGAGGGPGNDAVCTYGKGGGGGYAYLALKNDHPVYNELRLWVEGQSSIPGGIYSSREFDGGRRTTVNWMKGIDVGPVVVEAGAGGAAGCIQPGYTAGNGGPGGGGAGGNSVGEKGTCYGGGGGTDLSFGLGGASSYSPFYDGQDGKAPSGLPEYTWAAPWTPGGPPNGSSVSGGGGAGYFSGGGGGSHPDFYHVGTGGGGGGGSCAPCWPSMGGGATIVQHLTVPGVEDKPGMDVGKDRCDELGNCAGNGATPEAPIGGVAGRIVVDWY